MSFKTSILLAASGFLFGALKGNAAARGGRKVLVRVVTWLVVALYSGIVNIGIMPTRSAPEDSLQVFHAAFWAWLYLTGPLMYVSLLIGTTWFLILIRRFALSKEEEEAQNKGSER